MSVLVYWTLFIKAFTKGQRTFKKILVIKKIREKYTRISIQHCGRLFEQKPPNTLKAFRMFT